ncbi:MAG: TfoX/Sxy family protein [Flavobacteriales bacterium]
MATRKETVAFLLKRLDPLDRFAAKPMFGEYAVYADGKPVALVCDDRLFVKILPASEELRSICEQCPPYPGAKAHYVLDEAQWSSVRTLPRILLSLAASLPAPKAKKVGRKISG